MSSALANAAVVNEKNSMEFPSPFNLKFTNSLSVLLRIVQRARKFVTNVFPHKFRNFSNLELLIHQEQRVHLAPLLEQLTKSEDPPFQYKTLVARYNPFTINRGVLL